MGRKPKDPDHYLFVTMTADPPAIEWTKCTREELDARLEKGGAHFIVIAGGEPVEPMKRYDLVPFEQLPKKERAPRKKSRTAQALDEEPKRGLTVTGADGRPTVENGKVVEEAVTE